MNLNSSCLYFLDSCLVLLPFCDPSIDFLRFIFACYHSFLFHFYSYLADSLILWIFLNFWTILNDVMVITLRCRIPSHTPISCVLFWTGLNQWMVIIVVAPVCVPSHAFPSRWFDMTCWQISTIGISHINHRDNRLYFCIYFPPNRCL